MARTRAADFDEKRRSILDSAAAVFAKLGMERRTQAAVYGAQHREPGH